MDRVGKALYVGSHLLHISNFVVQKLCCRTQEAHKKTSSFCKVASLQSRLSYHQPL